MSARSHARIAVAYVAAAVWVGWVSGCIVPPAAPTLTPTAIVAVATATPSPTPPPPSPLPPSPTVPPSATAIPTPLSGAQAAATPLPPLTLKSGDAYFSLDGASGFLLTRNLTGITAGDFNTLLDWAYQGHTRLIRLHLTHGWSGPAWATSAGTVNESWARQWDQFFDRANADGIYVLPVFGVWADWNDGQPDYGFAYWSNNPFNAAKGGPVQSPGELFQPDSAAQKLWLNWMQTLVERWRDRPNIAGWEIFSEINIAAGAAGSADAKGGVSAKAGVDFANRAAAVIRAADPAHRPLTLSLAGTYPPSDAWAQFYQLDTLDFIEIHPYTTALDREVISSVRQKLTQYAKPVMIGEAGLYAYTTELPPGAGLAVNHAIWAGLVSGAMNGRGLWFEDGYAIYSYDRATAFDKMRAFATAELPVARFVEGVNFAGFKPLPARTSAAIFGAAVGNETSVLGWFRDGGCEPPNWNLRPVLSKQTVTLTAPGAAANWKVDFYNTKTGVDIVSSVTVKRQGSSLTLTLPDFTDDVAFKMSSQ
jgi:hypothetical protein